MTREIKYILAEVRKSKYPYEEYLEILHADAYMGTDDDMADSFEHYITNLDGEEHIEHANVLIRLLLENKE